MAANMPTFGHGVGDPSKQSLRASDMAQMSGMMQQFSVQVLDLVSTHECSSSPRPVASFVETLVPMVSPQPRSTTSSIKTLTSLHGQASAGRDGG